MNLSKLFKAQKELGKVGLFNYQGEDRFNKLILALLVELGECANEWRGFKFWSKDQEPRTFKREGYPDCEEKGYRRGNPPVDEIKGVHGLGNHWYDCEKCRGFLVIDKNPLLEEYVDGLHFVLEIGIEHEFDKEVEFIEVTPLKLDDIVYQFTELMRADWYMYDLGGGGYFHEGLELYLGLGEMIGFTSEQIEQAYFEKNSINLKRQENGY